MGSLLTSLLQTWAPYWRHFPKFFKAVSKQHIAAKQQQKVLTLKLCIFFEVKKLIFRHFSKIWKLNNPCEAINSKLGQKRAKYYTIIQL